jgi:hypothetical protein
MVGGRGRDRTGDPLLAKQRVENTKVLCWCRLHEKPSKLPPSKCTEVVPSSGHRGSCEGLLRSRFARKVDYSRVARQNEAARVESLPALKLSDSSTVCVKLIAAWQCLKLIFDEFASDPTLICFQRET